MGLENSFKHPPIKIRQSPTDPSASIHALKTRGVNVSRYFCESSYEHPVSLPSIIYRLDSIPCNILVLIGYMFGRREMNGSLATIIFYQCSIFILCPILTISIACDSCELMPERLARPRLRYRFSQGAQPEQAAMIAALALAISLSPRPSTSRIGLRDPALVPPMPPISYRSQHLSAL